MSTDALLDRPDTELVTEARAGNQAAFAELVRRHERRVYNLAYRMLGRAEDARDAAQDAFVSCYRNLRRFRGDAAFSTWLHRIAVNACYDILRKRPQEAVELSEGLAEGATADHADPTSTGVDVQRALARIAIEFRVVVVMHDVLGYPYEDIAATLEVPLGTVKSRLHRGRVALGEELGAAARIARTRREPQPARAPSKRSTTVRGRSRRS
ncbi:MAG: sigma-70 family RNA polymerase sigma factor [Actinomycetota bacterium]